MKSVDFINSMQNYLQYSLLLFYLYYTTTYIYFMRLSTLLHIIYMFHRIRQEVIIFD